MNNQPTPPSSSSLPEREFRLELNSWLQSRRWRNRLTSCSEESKEDNDGKLTRVWLAIYRFDGKVYGESKSYGSAKEAKEEAARIAYRQLLWEETKPVIRNRLN